MTWVYTQDPRGAEGESHHRHTVACICAHHPPVSPKTHKINKTTTSGVHCWTPVTPVTAAWGRGGQERRGEGPLGNLFKIFFKIKSERGLGTWSVGHLLSSLSALAFIPSTANWNWRSVLSFSKGHRWAQDSYFPALPPASVSQFYSSFCIFSLEYFWETTGM